MKHEKKNDEMFAGGAIKIRGAREHNLKNISLDLPRGKMVVFTGLSGSGKSSLAFDTIFAEGQRRYIESLSAYARQFLGRMDKPDVDEIEGLSPAISIDQKSHSANPRSTVATITEIYDYLRVLFARVGVPHCPICGKRIRRLTAEEIVDATIQYVEEHVGELKDKSFTILAPVVKGRKGEYYQMLYDFLNAGFRKVRIDGKYHMLRERIVLGKYQQHTIELVVDQIPASFDFRSNKDHRLRLAEAIEHALKYGDEVVTLSVNDNMKDELTLSSKFACPEDQFSFPEIEPRLFSFNSPYGACETCHGIGTEELWSEKVCPVCEGKRLKKESLSVLVGDKNISQVVNMPVGEAHAYFSNIDFGDTDEGKGKRAVAELPLREITSRLKFMIDVGLDYLTLERKAGTLSGGEAQRIRLASQIGSRLVGTLYILDEPTIGLHQRDNAKLIATLQNLRDLGNTIVVVEHDEDTIRASDYLVDFGPGAGVHGGKVVVAGPTKDLLADQKSKSMTVEYLRGERKIEIPRERRKVTRDHEFLKVKGATANNLKDIDVAIPLRRMTAVTGVSGSGKSSLVYDVLYKTLANKLNGASMTPGAHKDITGLEYVNRVVNIDQGAIGRTPRSNPATYIGAWTFIRELFASSEDARLRGWGPGRFSFNVPGGRCENCEGHGTIAIEMHFLPTVYVPCDVCKGRRFDRETLEVLFHEKNIYDILKMTVDEAVEFFDEIPQLHAKLKILQEVGLGYLELGQSATTLSGGEAQRVKLSAELGKPDTRKTLYLLDEPTTGLHFDDVRQLLVVLERLVTRGNTVVVIEHNLDVIKTCDWVIDLGPDGGERGGELVASGTPELISKTKNSITGEYLSLVL